MPGTMTEHEPLLSLLSIEVLVSHVHIDMNIPCHLPCIVFRLLDYPAVSIPYFDQWQIEDFHNLKRDYPHLSWRQLLSDQFYELRSANGKFNFKRGKSCLFKTYFQTLYTHLLNVPLFLLLIDQINDKGTNNSTTQFVGSCNVKLNELIEMLNQSIIKNGKDIPLVEQETFHCPLFNLMGTKIGTCDVAVRFCHYGTTILTHLPMLDEGLVTKLESKTPVSIKEQIKETSQPSSSSSAPPTDKIVKHIHFVNEKRDVGLQISRSDLPSPGKNQSAQTRWTSTKTHPRDLDHSRGRYLRTREDPTLDDPSIASYQPPALYFNSNTEFLQMITPKNAHYLDEAKENRLSYLASIPIASFNDDIDFDDDRDDDLGHQPKQSLRSKPGQSVRFNLPSSTSSTPPPTTSPRTKLSGKSQPLARDFLSNFPLLRALVEEALTLQEHQYDVPSAIGRMIFAERPQSAGQQRPRKSKPIATRPRSAATAPSARVKSLIVTRKQDNISRLYPPSRDIRQRVVTKHEVRNLVDRLSQPKYNKRFERQVALAEQMATVEETPSTPRPTPRPTTTPTTSAHKNIVTQKPPLSYGTTRAHRLYTEHARARRAAHESRTTSASKSPVSPRKETSPPSRPMPPLSPQLLNTGTLSHFSLLNKVDLDSATIERNSLPQTSTEQKQQNTGPGTKSSSTTSQDVSFELRRSSSKTSSSSSSSSSTTPEPTIPALDQPDTGRNDLGFSITDVTDYFTDGGNNSSTRPSTRQST